MSKPKTETQRKSANASPKILPLNLATPCYKVQKRSEHQYHIQYSHQIYIPWRVFQRVVGAFIPYARILKATQYSLPTWHSAQYGPRTRSRNPLVVQVSNTQIRRSGHARKAAGGGRRVRAPLPGPVRPSPGGGRLTPLAPDPWAVQAERHVSSDAGSWPGIRLVMLGAARAIWLLDAGCCTGRNWLIFAPVVSGSRNVGGSCYHRTSDRKTPVRCRRGVHPVGQTVDRQLAGTDGDSRRCVRLHRPARPGLRAGRGV